MKNWDWGLIIVVIIALAGCSLIYVGGLLTGMERGTEKTMQNVLSSPISVVEEAKQLNKQYPYITLPEAWKAVNEKSK